MEVDLPEQFLPPSKYNVYVTKYLFVVGKLIIDHSRVLDDSLVADLWIINLGVNQVSVEVVQLVQVKRTRVIWYNVEQPSFIWVFTAVSIRVTSN